MPSVKKESSRTTKRAKTGDIWADLMPMGDQSGPFSINIYGRSGTGKTRLWGTFPKPILAVICSGGLRPGELRSLNSPKHRGSIYPHVLREPSELSYLMEQQQKTGKFKTIVLDHASNFQDRVLFREVLQLPLDQMPQQKSWGLARKQDYGDCISKSKEYFAKFLSLDCYRVMIAQERNFAEKEDTPEIVAGDRDYIKPFVCSALSPKLAEWLNPACDYIGQTYIRPKTREEVVEIGDQKIVTRVPTEGYEYCLRVGPHDIFATKFRVAEEYDDKLEDAIVNPTFDKIKKIVDAGLAA